MIIPRRKTDHVIDRGMRILYKDEEGEHRLYEGELKISPYTLEQRAAGFAPNKVMYTVIFDKTVKTGIGVYTGGEVAEAFRKYLKHLEEYCVEDVIL
jgi:hypothetical protein